MFAYGTRRGQCGLAVGADGLFAAGQAEGIDGELAADGAPELGRNLVLRQRAGAGVVLARRKEPPRVL